MVSHQTANEVSGVTVSIQTRIRVHQWAHRNCHSLTHSPPALEVDPAPATLYTMPCRLYKHTCQLLCTYMYTAPQHYATAGLPIIQQQELEMA